MVPSLHVATGFPFYLHLDPYIVHPHFFFEALSYVIAFAVYLQLRRRFADPIASPLRWAVIAAAVSGAALGAKLLFWFEDPQLTWQHLHDAAYLLGGKTIVGALVFGLLSVELFKRYVGLRASTGDLYAIPLALGIAIGRIGCFLTGLSDNTYGTPTNLPWAVNFGDGIPRHPTQLYEIIFLIALIPLLYRVLTHISIANKKQEDKKQIEEKKENDEKENVILSGAVTRRSAVTAQSKDPEPAHTGNVASGNSFRTLAEFKPRFLPGDAFKLFMVAYMSFRLLCDFIKPYPRILLGLGGIQWACILTLLYYSRDVVRWLRLLPRVANTRS